MKDTSFSYVGKTKSLRKRIQQHNSVVGSVTTELLHLRPYVLFAYICSFDSKNTILYYVEILWKEKRNNLRRNGVHNIKAWAFCGSEIIQGVDEENFGDKQSDLTLVCLIND